LGNSEPFRGQDPRGAAQKGNFFHQ
jgi:hypothetical protein